MPQRWHEADVGKGPDSPALDVVELHDDTRRGHDDVLGSGVRMRVGCPSGTAVRARPVIGTTTGSTLCQPGGAPSRTVTTQSAQPVPRAVQVSQSISMDSLLRELSAR